MIKPRHSLDFTQHPRRLYNGKRSGLEEEQLHTSSERLWTPTRHLLFMCWGRPAGERGDQHHRSGQQPGLHQPYQHHLWLISPKVADATVWSDMRQGPLRGRYPAPRGHRLASPEGWSQAPRDILSQHLSRHLTPRLESAVSQKGGITIKSTGCPS